MLRGFDPNLKTIKSQYAISKYYNSLVIKKILYKNYKSNIMSLPVKKTDELDWVKLRADMDAIAIGQETFSEKAKRKFSANPLIPIGCLITSGALIYGLWSFKTGNRQMSQYMMRLRVAAQGFTIVAFVVGVGFATVKE